MPSATQNTTRPRFRPQFSMRAFLIFVTFVCAPLAFVGSIKYRAHTYRSAISELTGRGIEVRQLRTENGETMWQRFVQDWIETDAYAGAIVEITVDQQDLTDRDVQLLGTFDEVRAVDLASKQLTDAALSQLSKLGAIRSLTIRDGAYTLKGVETIGKQKHLKALDLSGIRLDFEKLSVLKPVLDVDELALVLDGCTPEQLEQLFAGKSYRRLYLENAALSIYVQQSSGPHGSFDDNHFPSTSMSLTAECLPFCKELTLKKMQLSDDTLTRLSQRKDLKLLSLWECHFDATIALKRFRSPGEKDQSTSTAQPVISLRGHATAKSELAPEEFAQFLNHPAVTSLIVEKLSAPDQALPTLLKLSKFSAIRLPAGIPLKHLIEIYGSNSRAPFLISVARTPAEFEKAVARHPKEAPSLLKYIRIHEHLSQHGVELRELQRKLDQAQKAPGQ